MAYSDYVQIYSVTDSAGTSESDERATQVAKIVAWINENFSDIVTSVNYSDKAVIVLDNDTDFGTAWGQVSTSTSNLNERRKVVYSASSDEYTFYGSTDNSYAIVNLGLFVCRGVNGYVFDFVNLAAESTASTAPPLLCVSDCSTSYSTSTRVALSIYSSNLLAKEAESTTVTNTGASYTFGSRNANLTRTLLTAISPYGKDIICDGIYAVNGPQIANMAVFELNGCKYLNLLLLSSIKALALRVE